MRLITYKQTGDKQTKPYITKDPNDPRIQAYQDSLDAYNYGKGMKEFGVQIYTDVRDANNKNFRDDYNIRLDLPGIKRILNTPYPNTNILPINAYSENYIEKDKSFLESTLNPTQNYFLGNLVDKHFGQVPGTHWQDTGPMWMDFKKPIQPVIYQEPKKVIKRTLITKKYPLTQTTTNPVTPQLTPQVTSQVTPTKPIRYREEKVVIKIRVPNKERIDLGRAYNQAGNTHEEERTVIRRVPIIDNQTTQKK